MEHYKLYINGKFVDSTSNKTFESINPATEEPWATIAEAQSEDVNNAVEAAMQASEARATSYLRQSCIEQLNTCKFQQMHPPTAQ